MLKALSEAREILSLTFIERTNPSPLRSSVKNPIPEAIASRGCLISSSSPLNIILPPSFSSRPKIARAVSVRPAPTNPPTPKISPALTWNEISVILFEVSPSTAKSFSPIVFSTLGNLSFSSRPTMYLMISSIDTSATSTSTTAFPSLRMVARSQRALISSRR